VTGSGEGQQTGQYVVRIEASAEMMATATHFRLTAHVEYWDGGTPSPR